MERRTKPIQVFHPSLPTPIRNLGTIDKVEIITPQTVCQRVSTTDDEQAECILLLSSAGSFVYYGFTEKDYLLMGQYLQESIRYIDQSQSLFRYYRSDTFKELFVRKEEVDEEDDPPPD